MKKTMTENDKAKKEKEYYTEQVRLAEINPELCDPKLKKHNMRNLKRLHERALLKRKVEKLTTLDNYWYTGPTGTGKSIAARDNYPDAYIKQPNKWWDGYDGEEVVIIDEFNKQHGRFAYYLRQWADHYPFQAEIKRGTLGLIRPKTIIIISRHTPEEIFKDLSTVESINRRFILKRFEKIENFKE